MSLLSLLERPRLLPVATLAGRGRAGRLVAASIPVAVVLVFVLVVFRTGLPLASAARGLAAVVLTQVVPGALLWRAVRPARGWWVEDATMGFALGMVLAVAAQVVAGSLGASWPATAAGPALGAVLLAAPATRRRIAAARTERLPLWWGPVVALLSLDSLQQLAAYDRLVPLRWATGFRTPNLDADFHLALAGELAHRGPAQFPYVFGEPLATHWFSQAWVAQVSGASGTGLDEVLFRLMPALVPLAVTATVAIAAVRLTGTPWAGVAAAALTMVGGDLDVLGHEAPGLPVAPLSPGIGISAVLLVAVTVLVHMHWNGELGRAGRLLLPVLALGSAGTKGSTLPLVVAGLTVAAVAMAALDRSRLRMVLTDLAVVTGCLGVALAAVFRGGSGGLLLDPAGALRAAPVADLLGAHPGLAALILAALFTVATVLARGAGLLLLVGSARGRRDPITWLLAGAGLAGACAVVAFTQPGQSQWYFLRSADPLLALGSALGLAALVGRRASRTDRASRAGRARSRHFAAGTLTAAVLVTSAGTALVSQARTHLPSGGPVTGDKPGAVSADVVRASRWIRDHSARGDLVMTNRHCTTPEPARCDARRFVVSAYSERRVLVEGWEYTSRALTLAGGHATFTLPYWDPGLLRLNDNFLTHPDAAGLRALQGRGVRWALVDDTAPHALTLEPWARLRLHTGLADVYQLAERRP